MLHIKIELYSSHPEDYEEKARLIFYSGRYLWIFRNFHRI